MNRATRDRRPRARVGWDRLFEPDVKHVREVAARPSFLYEVSDVTSTGRDARVRLNDI